MKIIFDSLKEYENKFQFKFLKPKLLKHSNGFISVQLDWTNLECEEFYKFKYIELAHRIYGGSIQQGKRSYYNAVTASFSFPELETEIDEFNKNKDQYICPWFNISIAVAKKNAFQKDHEFDYIFFENTKYGLICWFAPKGWEDWHNAKPFKN